ncbi:AsnC family protein [Kitasatospora sp. NPDC059146]|uniref:AsnC family protein n=1 Tax=Kitasatospora sp. NPDC059146 TaxID=3346741 RepID=UPI0036C373BA
MTDRSIHRPGPLIACCTLAALGAALAVPAALADAYAVCAVGLFALGGGALAAYRTVRGTEHRTDHAVLERLRQEPALGPEALADQLGLRPAAVRLSLRRLTVAGQLPPLAAPPG